MYPLGTGECTEGGIGADGYGAGGRIFAEFKDSVRGGGEWRKAKKAHLRKWEFLSDYRTQGINPLTKRRMVGGIPGKT